MTNLEGLKSLLHTELTLLLVRQRLDLTILENKEMPLDPTVVDVIKKLDDATNAVAARLQTLIDQVKAGMSAADIVAALTPEVDRLTAMGAAGTPASIAG